MQLLSASLCVQGSTSCAPCARLSCCRLCRASRSLLQAAASCPGSVIRCLQEQLGSLRMLWMLTSKHKLAAQQLKALLHQAAWHGSIAVHGCSHVHAAQVEFSDGERFTWNKVRVCSEQPCCSKLSCRLAQAALHAALQHAHSPGSHSAVCRAIRVPTTSSWCALRPVRETACSCRRSAAQCRSSLFSPVACILAVAWDAACCVQGKMYLSVHGELSVVRGTDINNTRSALAVHPRRRRQ